jgi:hypothetical membrane protein
MKKAQHTIAILWVFSIVWFNLAQLICGLTWTGSSYSWRHQDVSDLGQTYQPAHILLNISLICAGLILIVGVIVLSAIWRQKSLSAMVARSMLCIAGLGFIVAGIFPSDTSHGIHVVLGAAPILLYGNFGLIFAAAAMDRRIFGRLWIAALLLGAIGLISGFLYFSETYLFFGRGIIERLWIYPPLIWSLIVGIRLFSSQKHQKYIPGNSANTLTAETEIVIK